MSQFSYYYSSRFQIYLLVISFSFRAAPYRISHPLQKCGCLLPSSFPSFPHSSTLTPSKSQKRDNNDDRHIILPPLFFRLFVCSFFLLFVHSFFRSFVRLFVCSFVRLFVRSFIRLFVRLFVRSFVRSFIVHSFLPPPPPLYHTHTDTSFFLGGGVLWKIISPPPPSS